MSLQILYMGQNSGNHTRTHTNKITQKMVASIFDLRSPKKKKDRSKTGTLGVVESTFYKLQIELSYTGALNSAIMQSTDMFLRYT